MSLLSVGLIVNPVSGIGGEVSLKGSDGSELQREAKRRGGIARGAQRAAAMFAALGATRASFDWVTWSGEMGENVLRDSATGFRVLGRCGDTTSSADTVNAARAMLQHNIDLLVFSGGDGTARDLYQVLGQAIPVLGIPSGVKMHSAVFATTPTAAAHVLRLIAQGGLVTCSLADVKDLDETLLQTGQIAPRFYGEMKVPEVGGYLQHTKESGRESEPLAVQEIVASVTETIRASDHPVILGPGGTLMEIKRALGMSGTLLGVDVYTPVNRFDLDVTAAWLAARVNSDWKLVVSFGRGQGILFGRGNQQLNAKVLGSLARSHIHVVSTRTKLASLGGRPLLVDTNDVAVDQALAGLIEVTAGYEDVLLYRVASDQGLPGVTADND